MRQDYAWLGRVNRLTRFDRPFRTCITSALDTGTCRKLTLLDVGAGDGSLGDTLEGWATARGWSWTVTSLDANPHCLVLGRRPVVLGSALALPFADRSFDVVMATTMTHHLSDEQTVIHFREAGRVARRLVVIVDLHRNPLFAAAVWALLALWRAPRHFREDGVLSVRRGWRVGEWRCLAAKAGLTGAQVRVLAGMQQVLTWQPPAHSVGDSPGRWTEDGVRAGSGAVGG